jgi:hypothetical protein
MIGTIISAIFCFRNLEMAWHIIPECVWRIAVKENISAKIRNRSGLIRLWQCSGMKALF